MADIDASTTFEAHDLDLGGITVTTMRDTAGVSAFAANTSTSGCGFPTACSCACSTQPPQPGVAGV
ncbi:thiazolylpeptide-type bacteriocin [Streptomyces sp. NBC_00249]|uniref:thiazolylpeptide-type bacteriocin n=1 Tax=Streptomyces sp. NBC_00249 TaxID=2975690 RepID=UPI002256B629|nr:thiazolylpeptide-type bacteriocin [Streptomyces sp. NBC_00249]MCX5192602.1 thiazolylpeptide-type bacteriocin [Streptomyces sp. NBC_00249]